MSSFLEDLKYLANPAPGGVHIQEEDDYDEELSNEEAEEEQQSEDEDEEQEEEDSDVEDGLDEEDDGEMEEETVEPGGEADQGTSRGLLKALLDKLLDIQDTFYSQTPELKEIVRSGNGKRRHVESTTSGKESEEEILSSPEESENEGHFSPEPDSGMNVKKKRRKFSEYPDILKYRHDSYRNYRNEVLLKWYHKTRLASGKFSAKKDFSGFETNVVKQIEQILANKYRLISRTQTKRSDYEIFGKNKKTPYTEKNDDTDAFGHSKELDPEIFDDDDFYQQLLRELIERKTTNVTDSAVLSRQWLEIEKFRHKSAKKKGVDTKASKARKIRYDVHKKLDELKERVEWTEEAKSELFSSLFGKVVEEQ